MNIFKYIKPEEIPIVLFVIFLAALFIIGGVIGIVQRIW